MQGSFAITVACHVRSCDLVCVGEVVCWGVAVDFNGSKHGWSEVYVVGVGTSTCICCVAASWVEGGYACCGFSCTGASVVVVVSRGNGAVYCFSEFVGVVECVGECAESQLVTVLVVCVWVTNHTV